MRRDNKASKIANEETLKQYTLIADQQRDRGFASKHIVDIRPWRMDLDILSYYLVQKEGGYEYILAEIKHRQIKYIKQRRRLGR